MSKVDVSFPSHNMFSLLVTPNQNEWCRTTIEQGIELDRHKNVNFTQRTSVNIDQELKNQIRVGVMEINSTNVNYTNKYLDPKLDR